MAGYARVLPSYTVLLLVSYCSALLELQESVEWRFHRSLYEYKTYGAITMEIFSIPSHPVRVNINSSVESSSSSCPLMSVKMFSSQFGIPMVSREGETFPDKLFVSKAPVQNISVISNNQSVVWQVEPVKPGQLYVMAILPRADTRIKQKGLQQECHYYMNLQATFLYYLDTDIYQLGFNKTQDVSLTAKSKTLFSFKVPVDAKSIIVELSGCGLELCPVNASVSETLTVSVEDKSSVEDGSSSVCHWVNGSCRLEVTSPAVSSLYYLSLSSDVSVNLTALIVDTYASINCNIRSRSSKAPQSLSWALFPSGHVFSRRFNSRGQFCICDTNHSGNLTTRDTFACTFVGDLGRETPRSEEDTSNFNDRFVTWDKALSPNSVVSLEVTDTTVVVTRFKLRTSDTGTSLNVYLHLPPEKTSENSSVVNVSLCLSAHRLQHPRECHTGALFNTSSVKDNSKNYIIIPYPQSGFWFISLIAQCSHTDTTTSKEELRSCKSAVTANVTIRLSPCVDGGCLKHGVCKLYMESDLLFSACNCFAGWRGYGCNDGSKAVDTTQEILGVYLLTLSNLCFIPGIVLAIRRRFYVEGLVYGYNMFFSTFYHACDSSGIYQLCILPYNALSFADFFASLLSFWVTLMIMARISQGMRSFLHMLSALFISLGEVYNRHGLLEQLTPIATGMFILLVSWALESYKRKALFPSKRRLLWHVLPGVILASAGLMINLAFQTDSNYKYTHSTWHVLVSFSIAFLLPPGRKQPGTPGNLSVQSGDITRQSLLGSQEFNANILHAHDAGVPDAPSEPSSPPVTPRNRREVGLKLLNRTQLRGSQNLVL